ncbi:bestrophin family protein [Rudaea sp.]|uniref:bestrophin family protein n=1 Tax=Rudaea sp. TaxID=2136325 RepID=UPI002ED219F4
MIVRPKDSQSIVTLLFALRGSIIPVIWPQVLYTVLLSIAIVIAEHWGFALQFSPNPAYLTLLGLTLAIFLGFRNTVAYQRWWDGRALWGDLVIASRDLARQTLNFMPGLPQPQRRQLVYAIIAFVQALRHHLRGTDADEDLRAWLQPAAYSRVQTASNRPNAVLTVLGEDYVRSARDSGIDSMLLCAMDQQVNQFSRVLGSCERIRNTPIPFAYILLLHRTVHIYCFILPFCLISSLGWFTPIAVGILAYTFFGLDAIGTQIEDPFDLLPNDLPLDALSRTIEINLREMLGESELPEPIEPKGDVLT